MMSALAYLAKERPPDPVYALAAFLLRNSPATFGARIENVTPASTEPTNEEK
nr:unnamed protein product [Callosobruchus analis]